MLKSPSKYLTRQFLRDLTENGFISPKGLEYSREEVERAIYEKEMRLASIEFNDALKNFRDDTEKYLQSRGKFGDLLSQQDCQQWCPPGLDSPIIDQGLERDPEGDRMKTINDKRFEKMLQDLAWCQSGKPMTTSKGKSLSKKAIERKLSITK